jgi:signal transduction histidine kinase
MKTNTFHSLNKLPFAFAALLVFLTFSYIRYDLHRSATQFAQEFEKQNYLEIGRSDVLAITTRLNSLLSSLPWVCIEAGRGNHIFFTRSRGSCSSGLLREAIDLRTGPSQEIHIRFVLTISNEIQKASLIFLASQILMLLFMIWTVQRAERIRTESESSLAQQALQVAHDIRSPLTALNVVLREVDVLPEDLRQIIRSSVGRIHDIANDLLERHRERQASMPTTMSNRVEAQVPSMKLESELLSPLIESVVTEKRLQYRTMLGVTIEFSPGPESYGLFAQINAAEFKRIISNMISNAVEALGEQGRVELTLKRHDLSVQVDICDNGKGIPPDVMPKIGQRGASFGKQSGNGLGFYHARQMLEAWRGKIELSSTEGEGTTVSISLPHQAMPAWLAPKIVIANSANVVVLDDDKSIHQIWDQRFGLLTRSKATYDITLHSFSTPDDVIGWYRKNWDTDKKTIFLIDYELIGQSSNGLQLIGQLAIETQSYLVTARFEEPEIREQCRLKSIVLIPKMMAGIIPIEVESDAS